MLAAGLVYYLRLPEPFRKELDQELINKTRETHVRRMSIAKLMEAETSLYLDNVTLEEGIAKNKALKVALTWNTRIAYICLNSS